jgi:hypothetical protein
VAVAKHAASGVACQWGFVGMCVRVCVCVCVMCGIWSRSVERVRPAQRAATAWQCCKCKCLPWLS